MADDKDRKDAEAAVAEAEAVLREAQERLVEEQGELRALVTRDVPMMVVEVLPDAHISHGGKDYFGAAYGVRDDDDSDKPERMLHGEDSGTELVLDGPTAIALVMQGQVRIVRSQ